jgi:hypothetical protein
VREVPPRGRQRERGPDESKCTVFDALSPSAGFAGSSLAEGAERTAKRTTAGVTFGLPPHQPLRRQLPPGEARGAPFQRGLVGARHFFPQSDREARAERGSERRRVGRAKITNFGGWESRGKGALKSPSLWRVLSSPSFCTSRKVVPPEGGTPVLSNAQAPANLQSFASSASAEAPSPWGR